jgi:WD40 repeat protein
MNSTADRVVGGGLDRLVIATEPLTGRQLLTLRDPGSACYSLAFSPDDHRLAASFRGGKICLWDARPLTGVEDLSAAKLLYPEGEVAALGTGLNGYVAFGGGGFGVERRGRPAPVLLFRGPDDPNPLRLQGHEIVVFSVAVHPSGRFVASSGDEAPRPGVARAKVWDATTGLEAFPLEEFSGKERLFALAFHPSGKWLVGAGVDRKIVVWNSQSGKAQCILGEHSAEITTLSFSPKGKYLGSVGYDDTVQVWDAAKMDQPQTNLFRFRGLCSGRMDLLAFTPDESRLAICEDDDTITIHDLTPSGREVRLVNHLHRPSALVFGPDGRWLASGGGDCTIRIWDPNSGSVLKTFRSHAEIIGRLRLSEWRGHTMLVSGSRDSTVRFWDVETIPGNSSQ